ncbi:hypothetical protein B0T19DRAFT_468036 [Cercophora scortea]|uniref:Uncharacterized protein n=1 Tax=Cercophora scortea TaxID=314031 RepID=A0AAE0I935_9PEZI|nr:hypothetical protein B0T19DRAFT_468036 [Cercophora scortea]
MATDLLFTTTNPVLVDIVPGSRNAISISPSSDFKSSPKSSTSGASTTCTAWAASETPSIIDDDPEEQFYKPSNVRHLPSKKWKERNWRPICLVNFLAIAYTVFSIAGGIGTTWWLRTHKFAIAAAADCGDSDSMSPTERHFQVNIQLIDDLTFAKAKLIDLAWDVCVGHGGRLVHGWIIYHVAAKTTTWMLECSALPYSLLFDLLFQPASMSSLWSMLRSFTARKRAKSLVIMGLMVYAVSHVLFFATIWSAATGYQGTPEAGYAMPDQSWITKSSEELTLCWLPDPHRMDETPWLKNVILGPRFGTVFSSLAELPSGADDMWNAYRYSPGTASSDAFQDIYNYARSKHTLQTFFSHAGVSFQRDSHFRDLLQWNETGDYEIGATGTSSTNYIYESDGRGEIGLPTVINGWQFLGVGQESAVDFVHNILRNELVRSVFYLDDSLPQAGIVPYTSTLWYNGNGTALAAPFLNFGQGCRWSASVLGECLCYKGQPMTADFRIKEHFICTNGSQYVWGFSSFITQIGIILEAVWCLVCICLWVSSTQHSNLVRHDRTAIGAVRNMLDLSEAISEELKGNISLYTDKELRKALKSSNPVGYAVRSRKDGGDYLGLVPVPGGQVARRSYMRIDSERQGA